MKAETGMEQALAEPKASKPDHVPDGLVYEFDYTHDPEFLRDPFTRAAQVAREAPPIFWTPHNGGHWMITGFDDVSNAFRDWEAFSSVLIPKAMLDVILANLPPGATTPMTSLPSSVDPPAHAMYRAPLQQVFSPKVAMGLKEEIRELAVALIEKVRPNGRCEVMSEITEPLPVQMFLKLFGLPVERQAEYRDIVKTVMAPGVHDIANIIQGSQTLVATTAETLIERRENPRDDIISAMWKLEIDGKPITLELMQSYSLTLFLAGLDTVMNAMTLGARHLAMNPALQAEVRADPSRVVEMTDELLRLYSFPMPIRMVGKDASFGDVAFKQGERVHFFLPGANRDPRQFEAPDAFRLGRDLKSHLGFGAGPHRCLGMHLARVELHVFYEELLRRLPEFQLDPERPPRFHGGMVTGPTELNIVWN
jgi:cytochrome P450